MCKRIGQSQPNRSAQLMSRVPSFVGMFVDGDRVTAVLTYCIYPPPSLSFGALPLQEWTLAEWTAKDWTLNSTCRRMTDRMYNQTPKPATFWSKNRELTAFSSPAVCNNVHVMMRSWELLFKYSISASQTFMQPPYNCCEF